MAVLSEDPSSIPGTYMMGLQSSLTPVTSFGFHGYRAHMWHTNINHKCKTMSFLEKEWLRAPVTADAAEPLLSGSASWRVRTPETGVMTVCVPMGMLGTKLKWKFLVS